MWVYITLLSAVFFALRQIAEKKAMRSSQPIDFYTAANLISIIAVAPFMFLLEPLTPALIIALVAMGLLSVASTLLLLNTIKKTELSNLAPFLNLSPVFVLFLGMLIGEFPSLVQLIGIAITIGGIYILAVINFKPSIKPRHMLHATIVALVMGAISIVVRFGTTTTSPASFFIYSVIVSMVFSVIIQASRGYARVIHIYRKVPKEVAAASLLAIASNFLAFYALSFPDALAALMIPIRRTSTLFTVIFSGVLLKEKGIARKIIASILMIIGIFIIAQT